MDALVGIGVLIAILLPFGAHALRRTRIWWVPGALLFIGAIGMCGQTDSTHGDVGGMQALANGALALTGIGLCGLSVLAFTLGGWTRLRGATKDPMPPGQLPVATVVTPDRPNPRS